MEALSSEELGITEPMLGRRGGAAGWEGEGLPSGRQSDRGHTSAAHGRKGPGAFHGFPRAENGSVDLYGCHEPDRHESQIFTWAELDRVGTQPVRATGQDARVSWL